MSRTKLNLFIITSFALIGLLMITCPFIYKDTSVKTTNNSFLFQQVFAQVITTATTNNSSLANTTTNNNHVDTEQTISKQGVVTSTQARHNETAHIAVILPHRDDGKSYTGVLTFSASQPVTVALLQKLPMDNKTLSVIDFKKYGGSIPQWIRDILPHHKTQSNWIADNSRNRAKLWYINTIFLCIYSFCCK